MIRAAALAVLSALTCLAAASPARAESPLPEKQLQAMGDMMVYQMSGAPGMMIGIVSGDQEALLTYGETAKGNGKAWSRDTVWAIGSVSKVFTTQMLAAMVASGEVKLTDPIAQYLPKGTKVPSKDGRQILLLDLATHTAGLPRGIVPDEEYGEDDWKENVPYKMDRAVKWLAANELMATPGTHEQYSNFGFGLLGQALAAKRGLTFGELVTDYYGKHGMKNVTVTPPAADNPNRARSYWMNGQAIDPDWVFDFEQPSGGIYANGHDMFRFVKLCLSRSAEQQPVNALCHATYVYGDALDNAQTFSDTGMALGWSVDGPENGLPTLLHKNGWVSGFNTWVIILPSENVGIFSVSNKPYLEMKGSLSAILRQVLAARE